MSDSQIRIEIDRSRCVLCGGPNDCALAREGEETDGPCWCVDESFPATLLTRATDQDGGDRCICRLCLEKDREDPGGD